MILHLLQFVICFFRKPEYKRIVIALVILKGNETIILDYFKQTFVINFVHEFKN